MRFPDAGRQGASCLSTRLFTTFLTSPAHPMPSYSCPPTAAPNPLSLGALGPTTSMPLRGSPFSPCVYQVTLPDKELPLKETFWRKLFKMVILSPTALLFTWYASYPTQVGCAVIREVAGGSMLLPLTSAHRRGSPTPGGPRCIQDVAHGRPGQGLPLGAAPPASWTPLMEGPPFFPLECSLSLRSPDRPPLRFPVATVLPRASEEKILVFLLGGSDCGLRALFLLWCTVREKEMAPGRRYQRSGGKYAHGHQRAQRQRTAQIRGPIRSNSGVCDVQNGGCTLGSAISHSGWHGCTEGLMCFEPKGSQFESS